MKRLIWILIAFCTIPYLTFSQADTASLSNVPANKPQDNSYQNFRIGLKASPSFAWIKPNTKGYESDGLGLGFSYGVTTEFAIAKNYSIATGLNITYTGGKLSYKDSVDITNTRYEADFSRKYNIKYLEIPFTLKLKTNEIGYFTYYAIFGLGTSFNLSAKADDEYEFNDGTQIKNLTDEDLDIKDDVSFFRESMILGIGAEYSLGGNTAMTFGLTFNNGFTDILKGKSGISGEEEKAISNFIEVNLGILF